MKWTLLSILFAFLIFPLPSFAADTVTVERVVDGDTFVTTDNEYIRLIGVDTPELSGSECYSKKAKKKLNSWIDGKQVTLKYDDDKYDRYGRTLAYVYKGDYFINRRLVVNGLATVLTVSPNNTYESKFESAEKKAQKKKRGMWKKCKSTIKEHSPKKGKKPKVKAVDTDSVTVSWKKSKNAKVYHLAYGEYGSKESVGVIKGIKKRKYTITGLDPDTKYWVKVRAKNPLKAGKYSKKRFVTTDSNEVVEEAPEEPVAMCTADTYNCSSFTTHDEAQSVYSYCVSQGAGDIHRLDANDDGVACESLK